MTDITHGTNHSATGAVCGGTQANARVKELWPFRGSEFEPETYITKLHSMPGNCGIIPMPVI